MSSCTAGPRTITDDAARLRLGGASASIDHEPQPGRGSHAGKAGAAGAMTNILSDASHELPDRGAAMATDEPPRSDTSTNEIRDLSRAECLRLLAAHDFGRLAVTMEMPVIRPVNYAFDEPSQSVVFKTAAGSKFHALLLKANAAFEIDGIESGSRTGWSVIIVGMTEEITNPSEVRRLDRLGLDHWAPGPKPHWMRIRAWTVTGRQIVVAGRATRDEPA
jgi:nitroimidazol reductase NimA-like FMN-containing flavoprotein (pyridoxamine 5'-phosphate oxidase superfamily)